MPTIDEAAAGEFAERLFGSTLGALELACAYIGDRLGLYRVLADHGPLAAGELAERAGIHPRYAREWVEQQTMSGIVSCDDPGRDDDARLYSLPPEHAHVLLDEDSLLFMAPMAQLFAACIRPIDAVVDAFRTGGGVPFAIYGRDLHEGQARFSRMLVNNLLTTEWLPAIPEVHERLDSPPPARIADLACGVGHSSLAMARGYPRVRVDGIDLDAASIAAAERVRNDAAPDVAARVTFACCDAADAEPAGVYQLVTIFEALHDMSHPVATLEAARRLLAPDGVVLVVDERTAERFSPDAGPIELFYYGVSVMHCLPVGMVGENPAGTGTVMRAETLRGYAERAGFAGTEVLGIDHDFYRFYLLRP